MTKSEIHAARLETDRLRARQEALLERMSDLRGQLEALEAETAPAQVEVGGKESLGGREEISTRSLSTGKQ